MKLTARFRDALVYAAELHGDQVRKVSGEPYLGHLLGVAALALEHGADEDEAIAALLHDAIEDQGGAEQWEEIRRRFGEAVAEIVAGCSDSDTQPKPPWRQRKEAYVAHLRDEATPSMRLISACDKLHNARTILLDYRRLGQSLWGHFKGGRDGTLWYYRAVVEAIKTHGTTPLLEELHRVVAELETLVGG